MSYWRWTNESGSKPTIFTQESKQLGHAYLAREITGGTPVPLLLLARLLISLRAMGPAPAGLLIESLFVTLNAVPAKKVRPIIRTNGLDDECGLAVTALATMDCSVLDGHRLILRSF